MAVVKLGPDVNVRALIDFADAKRLPQGRVCEECFEEHHPRRAPHDGARYFLLGMWRCGPCMFKFLESQLPK